jgi:hypothetical protein
MLWMLETCRVLEIKAKIQLHLVGYIYTYLNTMHGNKNLKKGKVVRSIMEKQI